MSSDRTRVLVGLTLLAALATLFVLWRVVESMVLAVVTAYVLLPIHRWIDRKGIPAVWSASVTTVAGLSFILLSFVPFSIVLYVRRQTVFEYVRELPESFTVRVGEVSATVDVATVQDRVLDWLSDVALGLAGEVPVFVARLITYGFVVFAVLYYHAELRILAEDVASPRLYRLLAIVHDRVEQVLFGHYALAILGASFTYLVGLLVFTGLEYSVPFALALLAGTLYLVPVLSPTYLVAGLALVHAYGGDVGASLAVLGFGGLGLVFLPTYVLTQARHHLEAPRPLSPAVYFVGFVGGGLTVGLVGFVVGPLLLAICLTLLEHFDGFQVPSAQTDGQ